MIDRAKLGHTPLTIPSRFKNGGRLWVLFVVTGVERGTLSTEQLHSILYKITTWSYNFCIKQYLAEHSTDWADSSTWFSTESEDIRVNRMWKQIEGFLNEMNQ